MVVSSRDRRPLQRPLADLGPFDVATPMVTGLHLSLEPSSDLSAALVLSHSVLPKEGYLHDRGVDVSWPVSGLPKRLHLDNAKEFQSLAYGAATAAWPSGVHDAAHPRTPYSVRDGDGDGDGAGDAAGLPADILSPAMSLPARHRETAVVSHGHRTRRTPASMAVDPVEPAPVRWDSGNYPG
jgi:hypothetical protein